MLFHHLAGAKDHYFHGHEASKLSQRVASSSLLLEPQKKKRGEKAQQIWQMTYSVCLFFHLTMAFYRWTRNMTSDDVIYQPTSCVPDTDWYMKRDWTAYFSPLGQLVCQVSPAPVAFQPALEVRRVVLHLVFILPDMNIRSGLSAVIEKVLIINLERKAAYVSGNRSPGD